MPAMEVSTKIDDLSENEKQFLVKRQFFYAITRFTAWGIMLSGVSAWGILYWLRPALVDSGHILSLLEQKKIDFIQLAEIAVTGASAMSALFLMLVFIAMMLFSSAKKEKQYLDIIEKLT